MLKDESKRRLKDESRGHAGVVKGTIKEEFHRWSQTEAHLQTAVIYAGWGYRTGTTEDVKRDRKH